MTDIQNKTKNQVKVSLAVIFVMLLVISVITAAVLSVPLYSLYQTLDKEQQIEKTNMLETSVLMTSRMSKDVSENSDRNMNDVMQFLLHVQNKNEWSAEDLRDYANTLGIGSFELVETSASAEDYAASSEDPQGWRSYYIKPDGDHILILRTEATETAGERDSVARVLASCTDIFYNEDPVFLDAFVIDRQDQTITTGKGTMPLSESGRIIPESEEEYEYEGVIYGVSEPENGKVMLHHYDETADMDLYTVYDNSPYRRTTASVMRFFMIVFIVTVLFCALYNFYVHQFKNQYPEDEEYNAKVFRRRIIVNIVFTIVINVITGVYAQYFYLVAACSMQDRNLITEADRLISTESGTTEEMRQHTRNEYLNIARLIGSYLSDDTERQNSSELSELKNIFALDSIVVYDSQGKERVSDGSVWNVSFPNDPEDAAYALNNLRYGRSGVFLDPHENRFTGRTNSAAAVILRGDGASPSGYLEIDISAAKTGSVFGNRSLYEQIVDSFADNTAYVVMIDEETRTLAETPWRDDNSITAESAGFIEDSLQPGYFSNLSIRNSESYVSTGRVPGRVMTVVRPASFLKSIDLRFVAGIILITLLGSVIPLYYMRLRRNTPMVYDESPFDRKDSLPVQIRNAEEVIRPEDRMGRLMHILLLIAIVVMVVLFYGQFVIQKEIPLFTEIMQYKWNKGLNIFALTYNIAIIEWTALSVFVLRRILRRIGQMSNAHGETITRLLRSAIRYISVIIVCYVILLNFGFNPEALASSAGLIGIAVGIGARDLITDIVAGLFIIFDRDYEVGDIVEVDDFTGYVHEIGMRVTKLTSLDGNEKIINNRNMVNVVNKSGPEAINIRFRVPYDTDINHLNRLIEEEAPLLMEKYPKLKSKPVFVGIKSFEEDMILCGLYATCDQKDHSVMTPKLAYELKRILDENGISMKRELSLLENSKQ